MSIVSPERHRRFGRIPAACEYSGLGRANLYKIAGRHVGLFRKVGRATLVDLDMLETIIEQSPPAPLGKTAATASVGEAA